MSLRILFVITLLISLLTSGCAGEKRTAAERLPVSHWFDVQLAGKPIRIQIAVTRPEMMRGLMNRTELGPDDGMLFLYPTPRKMSFWMRNTPLPLDIGYFDADGILREIYPLHPFDEAAVESRSDRIQFALEMNQGWFSQNEIRPGARLNLELVSDAVAARGFEPSAFGLPTE